MSDTSQIAEIGERILTQDNRSTSMPMFCVQQKRRETGYHTDYTERRCWWNADSSEMIYDDDLNFKEPEGDDWEEFGYVDMWETVMVAFTEDGCKEYLQQNEHNLKKPRIYVESFHRCPEMIAIREFLIATAYSYTKQ